MVAILIFFFNEKGYATLGEMIKKGNMYKEKNTLSNKSEIFPISSSVFPPPHPSFLLALSLSCSLLF